MLISNYQWVAESIPTTPPAGGPKPCVWIAAPPYRGNEPHHIQVIAPNTTPYCSMFCGDLSGYRYLMIDVRYFGHQIPDWIDARYVVNGCYFARDIVTDVSANVFSPNHEIRSTHGVAAVELARQIRSSLMQIHAKPSNYIGISVVDYPDLSFPVVIDMERHTILSLLSFRQSSRRRLLSDYLDDIDKNIHIIYDGNCYVDRALFTHGLSAKLDRSGCLGNAASTLIFIFSTPNRLINYQQMVHFNSSYTGLITDPDLFC